MLALWRFLIARLGRLWLASLRIRWTGEELPSDAVLALWHEHLPACIPAFAHRSVAVLISRSDDGEWAASACTRWGYRVQRGSSSIGSLSGMKALARTLAEQGGLAGMALDGPRGPRHIPKLGSLWLASRSGIPIVPIAVRARRHFRLRTWDRSLIPFPFSRVDIRLGVPLHPRSLAEIAIAMETNQAKLETAG